MTPRHITSNRGGHSGGPLGQSGEKAWSGPTLEQTLGPRPTHKQTLEGAFKERALEGALEGTYEEQTLGLEPTLGQH